MSQYKPELPEIIPQRGLLVEDEKHQYKTFPGSQNSINEKTKYTLEKSPVQNVQKVTGVYNGDTIEFTQGTDYTLSDQVKEKSDSFTYRDNTRTYQLSDGPDSNSTSIKDNNGDTYTEGTDYKLINPNDIEEDTIEWLDGGSSPDSDKSFTVSYTVTYANSIIDWDTNSRTPDAGSFFYVTYKAKSIIGRFIESSDEEFVSLANRIEQVTKSKFVDKAEGDELDELGKLFGPVIGKRNERDDTQYRIYLKSVVQSFISRGTNNGIKLAVSAATDVPVDDITITEDFTNNEYEINVVPNTPVTPQIIEDVAEIADPSGISLLRTRFTPTTEEIFIDDSSSFSKGFQNSDQISVDDSFSIGNKTSSGIDEVSVDDSTDSTEGDRKDSKWADTTDKEPNWSFFEWVEIIDTRESVGTDSMAADDATASNDNKFSVAEEAASDDSTASSESSTLWGQGWNNFDWTGSVQQTSLIDPTSTEWGTRWGNMEWA